MQGCGVLWRGGRALLRCVKHVRVEHMEDALDTAISMAQPGDEVVLSPACSSFDEFDSFEHRGKVFKQLVAFRANNAR